MSTQTNKLLAQLAHSSGLASADQINHSIGLIKQQRKAGHRVSLDAMLVQEGVLSPDQAAGLLTQVASQISALPAAEGPAVSPARASSEQDSDDSLCGTTLGGYKIISRLGAGAMGVIYKAEQIALERVVALKMLNESLADDAAFVNRFLAEACSVAALNHPNLIQIFDVVNDDKRVYFSMEFIEGESVGALLDRQNKLDLAMALDIVIQIASALGEAHQTGIIHRDVKPDNILLTTAGVAKLSDLGIAKRDDQTSGDVEQQGMVGTPYYVSPEQAFDSDEVDARADFYSLGATFFHLVTGEVPYSGRTAGAIFMKQAKLPTPEVSDLDPGLPIEINRVIRQMMDKNPDNRYPHAAALVEALEDIRQGLSRKQATRQGKLKLGERMTRIEAPAETQASAFELDESSLTPRLRAEAGPSYIQEAAVDSQGGPTPAQSPPHQKPLEPSAEPSDVVDNNAVEEQTNKPSSLPKLIGVAVVLALIGVIKMITGSLGEQAQPSPPSTKTVRKPPPKPRPKPPPTPKPGPNKGKQPELTPKQIMEQKARKAYDQLRQQVPSQLKTDQLETLKEQLETLISDYGESKVVTPAKQGLKKVELELERRGYQAACTQVDNHLTGKAYSKATHYLEQKIAGLTSHSSMKERYHRKLQQVAVMAKRASLRAISQAAGKRNNRDLAGAKTLLVQALAGQLPEHKKLIQQKLDRTIALIRTSVRGKQLELYEPYYKAISPVLMQQQYSRALILAKGTLTNPMAQMFDVKAEMADIRALANTWEKIAQTLSAQAGEGPIPLRFVGQLQASPVKVIRVSRGQIYTATSIKRLSRLHRDSLLQLGGSALGAEGPLRQLRLALLLHTFGQIKEATVILATQKGAKSHERFELRLFCWRLDRVRNVMAPKDKKYPQWLKAMDELAPLIRDYKDSDLLTLVKKLTGRWLHGLAIRLGPKRLMIQAKKARQDKKFGLANKLLRHLVTFYPRSGSAKEAQRLLPPEKRE